ncbi:MAG TPA: lysylphosphatidylglycerol synthase transmembrane domain-containing protein [Gemmatimonadaceae bacterium]|nr:lysylphosphatidylglycerol synthase transmembrane domain-containing protein [Gemmatimonadaceae bacterium]
MSPWRWVIVALSFAATTGITAYLLRIGLSHPGPHPVLPLWAHGAALLAVLLEIGTRAVKIHWSAAALRMPLRFGTALRVCLGGDFAASITPARSGAEPARFLVLAEDGIGSAPSLLILFTELLLETWSLMLLCVVFLVVFRDQGSVLGLMTAMIGGYALLVLAAGAAAYGLARRHASGPPPRWALGIGLHAGRWRPVQRALRSLRSNLSALRHAALGPMAGAFITSLLHVGLRLAVLPIIALALDPSLPFSSLVLWPLVFLYGGAVAPAPGGGGAVEFGFRYAYNDIMAPAVLGGALLWWRFYTFYLYVLLGGISVGGTVLKALRAQRHGRLHQRAVRAGTPGATPES